MVWEGETMSKSDDELMRTLASLIIPEPDKRCRLVYSPAGLRCKYCRHEPPMGTMPYDCEHWHKRYIENMEQAAFLAKDAICKAHRYIEWSHYCRKHYGCGPIECTPRQWVEAAIEVLSKDSTVNDLRLHISNGSKKEMIDKEV